MKEKNQKLYISSSFFSFQKLRYINIYIYILFSNGTAYYSFIYYYWPYVDIRYDNYTTYKNQRVRKERTKVYK